MRPPKEFVTSNDVTLRQLRYFSVLAEQLNYRKAAESLFISQPALSTAIKLLEQQFGVQLFERNTREVTLTETGAAWLPSVRDSLTGVDRAVAALVELAGASRARIRFGYLIGTGADMLFRLVRRFEEAYPEIEIEATEFDFSDPTAGLGTGATEVALIRPPVDLPEHRMLVLDSEDWVACLPRDHRLAGRSEVAIAELIDDPIISAPTSAGTWRDHWLALDARNGREPVVAAVASTYETETTLVARGIGISFTTHATARLYDREGVVYVPITDRPPSVTNLAWLPGTLTREGELLVRHVRAEWGLGDS